MKIVGDTKQLFFQGTMFDELPDAEKDIIRCLYKDIAEEKEKEEVEEKQLAAV